MTEDKMGKVPVEIVKNSFIGSGYYFEDEIDYGEETESEHDIHD